MNRSFTAALLIALLSTTSALAQAKAWRVTEIKGAVQIETNGVRRVANGPMQIAPGDVVTTGRDGRVVLTQGQDFVLVAPNSRLRIAEPKANGLTQIFEDLGSAVFKIEKQSAPHFSVQTPYLAAVVKGTTFSVNVTNEGASVQVTEGAVQVSTLDGNATQLVTPGMIGMVSERQQQQLVVDTGGSRRTEGPAQSSAAGVAAPEASPNAGDLIAGSNGGASENAPSPVAVEARIAAVAEAPVSLAQASGGLISGELTASIIPVSNARASEQAQTVLASLTNPGAGSSVIPAALAGNNGNSGNGNNGVGNGNTEAASAAGNNGNAATGNNGNSGNGNPGNGNGNAGTETAAAGNNGNGNAGNGNSGNANSGNGNGNAGTETAAAGNSGNAATGANGNAGNGNSGNGNGNAATETAAAGNNANAGTSANGNAGNGNSGNGNGNAGTETAAAGNNGNGNGNSGAGAIGVEVVVSAPGNSGAGNAGSNGNSGNGNSGNGNAAIEVVVSAPGNSGAGNGGGASGNGNANAGASSNSGNGATGGIEVAVGASGSGNGNGNAGVSVGIGNAGLEVAIGGNGNGNAATEVASIVGGLTGQGADKGIGKK